jgi:hypothetical protein
VRPDRRGNSCGAPSLAFPPPKSRDASDKLGARSAARRRMSWFWFSILILALVGANALTTIAARSAKNLRPLMTRRRTQARGERTSDASAFGTTKRPRKTIANNGRNRSRSNISGSHRARPIRCTVSRRPRRCIHLARCDAVRPIDSRGSVKHDLRGLRGDGAQSRCGFSIPAKATRIVS